MKPKPRKDWDEALLEEERHQDEINEMFSNENDYDEAAAYEHEGDE